LDKHDAVMADAVLSVDFRKTFSTKEDGIANTARVCIDMKAIQAGLLKEIGANRIAILLAIVSYMDDNGRAFPSQEKIAELTGQGRATVQRNLEALAEAEFNGQKLLYKEVVGTIRKKTIYTLSQAMITNTDDIDETFEDAEVEEQLETDFTNARETAFYFLQVFEESFGYKYNMTFNREIPMIKNKLCTKYQPTEIKAIIDIGVGEYKQRWSNEKYPHPSVAMLTGWVGNEALGIYNTEKEKVVKQEQRKQTAIEQDDTDRVLNDLFDI
jgi:Helix-turn-helix domain